jgi:hypothetical protein
MVAQLNYNFSPVDSIEEQKKEKKKEDEHRQQKRRRRRSKQMKNNKKKRVDYSNACIFLKIFLFFFDVSC